MKFTIERTALLKSLAHGQNVVERRNTLPILGNVLLTAEDAGLTLTTTNMDLALVEDVDAHVDIPGQTTVSAHLLYDVVRKLPDGVTLAFAFDEVNWQLHILAGRSRFQLPCLPMEDFPQLQAETLPYEFAIETEHLKMLIERARFAMSAEDTRYYLNGIHFHILPQQEGVVLRSVATDSHRLACLESALPIEPSDIPAIIVGRKTVTEVFKLLDESTGPVTVGFSPKRIQFRFKKAILSSRLIDGIFPDYERTIPHTNSKQITINTKAFVSAIDRVATMAHDAFNAIKLKFANHTLTLVAAAQEMGSAVEEISAVYPHDDPLEISFNAKYLLEVVEHIDDEETRLYVENNFSAVLLKGSKDERSLYVLMPIRG